MTDAPDLSRLLRPERVAIVGSVSAPDRMGARTARHLAEAGFAGEVEAVSDAGELAPGPIDVAVVAVPARAVPDVLGRLAGRAEHAIVYSSGFGEAGGTALRGIDAPALVGPNTVGVYWAPARAVLTFAQAFDDLVDCRTGRGVALVSQSGAFGARVVRAARHRGLVIDGFVATGNEDRLTAADALAGLVALETDRPRAVGLYLESVRDGAALAHGLALAAEHDVHVVVLVGGRTAAGADAAHSHTAAVSPDHAVLDELVRLHGGATVRSDRELVDALVALAHHDPVAGRRVAVVTGSGGAGVVAADLLAAHGARVPPLGAATRSALAARLPSYAAVANPVDVTAQAIADTTVVGDVVADLAASGDVDAVLVVARGPQAESLRRRGGDVPVVVALLDGEDRTVAGLVEEGVVALGDLEAGVRATVALLRDDVPLAARSTPVVAARDDGAAPAGDQLTSLRAVEQAGVPVAPWVVARSAQEARDAVARLGAPVVVKANVGAAVHKAAAGAIRLDLTTPDAVAAAFAAMGTPEVVVARQLRGGPELFAGVRRDPVFGLVVVAGLGGGAMELLDRTVSLPADASLRWLTRRVHDVVFGGAERWTTLAEQLAAAARRLVELAARTGADLAECNPLIPGDDGLVALDARLLRNE